MGTEESEGFRGFYLFLLRMKVANSDVYVFAYSGRIQTKLFDGGINLNLK